LKEEERDPQISQEQDVGRMKFGEKLISLYLGVSESVAISARARDTISHQAKNEKTPIRWGKNFKNENQERKSIKTREHGRNEIIHSF
jgi:hypothetical protein